MKTMGTKMMNKGTLFILTGPSGTGKGTVLKEVLKKLDKIFMSVSATTRLPRQGEIDGQHYFFLDKQDFEKRIEDGDFLEHARYVDNYYGTLEAPVDESLENGEDVILEIEVQGALQVKEKRPDAVMVFIAPPDFKCLEERLRGRGTENEEKVQRRLETAREEMNCVGKFDYIVVNDEVDRAANELTSIVLKYRNK